MLSRGQFQGGGLHIRVAGITGLMPEMLKCSPLKSPVHTVFKEGLHLHLSEEIRMSYLSSWELGFLSSF